MNRRAAHWLNGGAATLTLLASIGPTALAGWAARPARPEPAGHGALGLAPPEVLADARGHQLTLHRYRRIASASTVADRLLLDLAEPDRILALSAHGARTAPWRYRYSGKQQLESLDDVEALLALEADLVLVNNYSDAGRVARLREAGIEVFDLGEMRGLATLLRNVTAVAALLGEPARGVAYAETMSRRLDRVSSSVPRASRCTGLYVSVYGDRIFGGTIGTSYHDVLRYAGLVDVAAEAFRDWPHYSAEDLLGLDPEILLTKPGMGQVLCRQPGLERLRVCRDVGRVVEIPSAFLDDPGPTILEAAELVFERVYAGRRSTEEPPNDRAGHGRPCRP